MGYDVLRTAGSRHKRWLFFYRNRMKTDSSLEKRFLLKSILDRRLEFEILNITDSAASLRYDNEVWAWKQAFTKSFVFIRSTQMTEDTSYESIFSKRCHDACRTSLSLNFARPKLGSNDLHHLRRALNVVYRGLYSYYPVPDAASYTNLVNWRGRPRDAIPKNFK